MEIFKAAVSQVYNTFQPPLEQNLHEATNRDNWNPTTEVYQYIAEQSFQYQELQTISNYILEIIKKSKNRIRILKSLNLIEYLIYHGSQKCLQYFKQEIYLIQRLQDYSSQTENKDQIQQVRQKSIFIQELLNNDQKLKIEKQNNKQFQGQIISNSNNLNVNDQESDSQNVNTFFRNNGYIDKFDRKFQNNKNNYQQETSLKKCKTFNDSIKEPIKEQFKDDNDQIIEKQEIKNEQRQIQKRHSDVVVSLNSFKLPKPGQQVSKNNVQSVQIKEEFDLFDMVNENLKINQQKCNQNKTQNDNMNLNKNEQLLDFTDDEQTQNSTISQQTQKIINNNQDQKQNVNQLQFLQQEKKNYSENQQEEAFDLLENSNSQQIINENHLLTQIKLIQGNKIN